MIIVLFPIIGLIAFILMCIPGLIITVCKTFTEVVHRRKGGMSLRLIDITKLLHDKLK